MSGLLERAYNPDILNCLANLSSDEVFTPPELANRMLDLLPPDIWRSTEVTILDPACKTGVFLREAAKRLIRAQVPDYAERSAGIEARQRAGEPPSPEDEAFLARLQGVLDHVFKRQLFGMAITELTSLLTRRSLYCSKYPESRYSIVRFDSPEGNVSYKALRHTWKGGKCVYCGASERSYERASALESYAYEFIHLDKPEEVFKMKFDVIIGNPPYQMSDGGNKASAMPIYQLFVEQAIKLNPRFLTMIIPARWYGGGKGLAKFRGEMLHDSRIRTLIDYKDSKACFPGVDIAGGVCIFLWDREKVNSDCIVRSYENGEFLDSIRRLDEFDVFIRDEKAVSIIKKVRSLGEPTMDSQVSSRKPFGLATNVQPMSSGDIKLKYLKGVGPFDSSVIKTGKSLINKWKVVASYVSFDHAGRANKDGKRRVLSVMSILEPGVICTETYLVYGAYDSLKSAKNLKKYLSLKLPRFLIAQLTAGQHITRSKFGLCPIPDISIEWDDETLYKKYGLSQDEIEFVENTIDDVTVLDDSE